MRRQNRFPTGYLRAITLVAVVGGSVVARDAGRTTLPRRGPVLWIDGQAQRATGPSGNTFDVRDCDDIGIGGVGGVGAGSGLDPITQRQLCDPDPDPFDLSQEDASPRTIDTFLGELTTISFHVNEAATVTLTIHTEEEGEAGPALYTDAADFPAGSHAFLWDGADDAGVPLPDDVYAFVLHAVSTGGDTDEYSPGGGGTGSGSGSIDDEYDPWIGDYWTMDYLNSSPSRVTMEVTPSGQSSFDVFTDVPYEDGTITLVWDGRDAAGQIVATDSWVYFPAPSRLRESYLIVQGETPTTTELAALPYLAVMSYEQVSRLAFTLARDADVTITVLPPGVADPDDPAGLRVLDAAPLAAGGWEVVFDPVDPDDPDEAVFYFDQEGTYTFAVEAVYPTTGASWLSRGVVNLVR